MPSAALLPRPVVALACVAFALSSALAVSAASSPANPPPRLAAVFIEKHCASCHDDVEKKSDLDLTTLTYSPTDPINHAVWVKIYDRVAEGEMPPKKKKRPDAAELASFSKTLTASLATAERTRLFAEGRATQRRLNRYEYENAVRDLLSAPWLQIRDALPEDGEANRFNKSGDALNISHVQMGRYLSVADYALRQVIAAQPERPETKTTRYYARDQRSFTGPMKFSVFNTSPERATFPMLGGQPQPDVRAGKAPVTAGAADPAQRDLEAVGVVASNYEPIEPKFIQFKAPVAGRYKLRFNAFSVWVGPGKAVMGKDGKMQHASVVKWWIPDLDDVTQGRRSEPVTIYSETPPRQLRYLGKFDVQPDPAVAELDVWLLAGETIRPDAARLFRSRPGASRWQNPLAEKDGQPGVAFRWLEVEGPLVDSWPTAGHRLLFGDLPLKKIAKPAAGTAPIEVVTADPTRDAEKLLAAFLDRAYRRPVAKTEVKRFLPVVAKVLKDGGAFADAMIAGYTAILCSPEFVCLEEKPGKLDDHAVAARLAFFLTNSAPDTELRALAAKGQLRQPAVLRAQTERLLSGPKSQQFVDAFLDYWLDLRKTMGTAPDSSLYDDYYLDDLLTESALEETQRYFAELIRADLPARTVAASDFAMINERLAVHYGLTGIEGVAHRRVPLPADSVRGGLMTQAAVLKVTANGTTTSPVVRGAWIMERILGQPPPPPPKSVPAVEPDIRGAATIRQQLDQHRNLESCASCHTKIDPPGFALESFDVMGAWRDRYRAIVPGTPPEKGFGHGGQKFVFHYALPVDASGELADGRKFADIREFKRLLAADEAVLARNLAQQFVVYATGAPVRFSDRASIEKILSRTAASHYGVRALIHEVIQSDLFLNK
jgi:mono/diheme cytochrome c family protein